MQDINFLSQKYLVNTYPNRNLTIEKGKGIYLFDEKGQKYLDFASNYGVNIFGYNFPPLLKTLKSQFKKISNIHCSFSNSQRVMASQKLIEKCGFSKAQVYWANSGAEAVEAAIKFAIMAKNKTGFIACQNSYHGKTLGALSLTFSEKYRKDFEKILFKVNFILYNSPEALQEAIDENTAAFILEPIQGEAGVILPDSGYLKKVREICDQKDILLIFDEIQTGCGRTGSFLACHFENVLPDILCLGKGLAGGLPVGAVIVSEKVFPKIKRLSQTSTFGGNPLVCALTLKTISLLDEKMLKEIRKKGDYFLKKIKSIKSEKIDQVRGKGLLIGLKVKEKRDEILKKLQEQKIIALPAGENVIRFLPPYIIRKKDIDFLVKKISFILKE